MIQNDTKLPMTFKKGDLMGTAAVVQSCMRGTADAHSMELLNVEDVAMGPTVTAKPSSTTSPRAA